jgi:hypothetical protein
MLSDVISHSANAVAASAIKQKHYSETEINSFRPFVNLSAVCLLSVLPDRNVNPTLNGVLPRIVVLTGIRWIRTLIDAVELDFSSNARTSKFSRINSQNRISLNLQQSL